MEDVILLADLVLLYVAFRVVCFLLGAFMWVINEISER